VTPLEPETTARYRKDRGRAKRRGLDLKLLDEVVGELLARRPLALAPRDHGLAGDYAGFRECHVAPDWLLVYLVDTQSGTLVLTRTGSHSDLFG
jgi:mRNA interferase YafQ